MVMERVDPVDIEFLEEETYRYAVGRKNDISCSAGTLFR